MTEAVKRAPTPAERVFAYHQRTKHRLERYAAGPETLDWTQQPNPFREFSGSPRTVLPLTAHRIRTSFADLYATGSGASQAITLDSVSALLELSMGLSAWKEYGPDRWALRCNPSSGNLHPTEAYVLCEHVPDLDDGLYHYLSRDHALEQRCRLSWPQREQARTAVWIGLSSVHWREAWKYGERAFRYCQLDVGHAVGALRYAAAALGWSLRLVETCDDATLARLLGLDRSEDFSSAESEAPDLLLAVIPQPDPSRTSRETATCTVPQPEASQWTGKANMLDPHPIYHWPVIDDVAMAAEKQSRRKAAEGEHRPRPYPYLQPSGDRTAVEVIRGRRSAQHFDRKFTMESGSFFHLLDCLLTRHALPWDVWRYAPHAHLLMFVHRVEGLPPGLYVLVRQPEDKVALSLALRKDFLWRRVETAPKHLPLYQLFPGDFRQISRTLNCRQAIGSDSCVSFAMLASFDAIVQEQSWRYRQLHWEAGLAGQVLYLEAEAMALRGTGIGCFFDDALHELLGLESARFQSLYHFTVGRALVDERISTQPPYPDRTTTG